MFKGSFVALITPFKKGKIDERAFQRFVDWQIREGTHGLVPVGTTGESPTLNHEEHKRVVELCIEATADRVPVIAGTGSNSTDEAIELTLHAQEAGADAALVVTPYYNKPTQAGLIAHYKAIHDATDIPIIIYNIPGRSVIDMTVETMAALAKMPRIAGVKDATADLARPLRLRQLLGNKKNSFAQLSGEDATAVAFNANGGIGCISVTANIAPRLCAQMHEASLAGDYKTALAIQEKLMPLHHAMFIETSPAPVKFAAGLLGFGDGSVRLPLVSASEAAKKMMRDAMKTVGLKMPKTEKMTNMAKTKTKTKTAKSRKG